MLEVSFVKKQQPLRERGEEALFYGQRVAWPMSYSERGDAVA